MAYIVFYDATELDKQQLNDLLKPTDHYWEFIEEPLGPQNVKPEAEMISTFITSRVSANLLDAMPKLKMIACRSTGFDTVDMIAAQQRDVTVANVPTYGEETVAEYAFALLLGLSRKLFPTIEAVRRAQIRPTDLTGFDLRGKTIGILGTGHIGQCMARIAKGFDMQVIAYDPFPKPEAASQIGFSYKARGEVAATSDVLSLHMPYMPANHHVINAEFLETCKPGAIIINTARGELVDTKALIDALISGRLGGAALDVVEGEQLLHLEAQRRLLSDDVSDLQLHHNAQVQALSRMPNVLLTPHNAFNTSEAIRRINQTTAENLINFWYGKVPNKVTPPPITPGQLIIVRHAESRWNAKGVWTGSKDIELSEKGFHEASLFGQAIKDIRINYAVASEQIRSFETLQVMLASMQQFDVPFERSSAINERDYGDYTGKSKWEVKKALGEAEFTKLRRSWDYPVPGGETLKMVYERTIPYYKNKIVPRLLRGETVLLVAHGNSIRSLVKYIERISDQAIADVEMLYGNTLLYNVDSDGYMTRKEVRKVNVTSALL